jgi:hypothetical protein
MNTNHHACRNSPEHVWRPNRREFLLVGLVGSSIVMAGGGIPKGTVHGARGDRPDRQAELLPCRRLVPGLLRA